MGGKSNRDQSQKTHQTSTSTVNDGQFAGASNVDASRTDIDYEVDNSIRTDYEYNLDQEIDNSVHTDYDYELNQDIDNSQHLDQDIDNSIHMDGEMAGNTGTINVLDGGAINMAEEIALAGFDTVSESLSLNAGVSEHALSEMGNTVDAMAGVADGAFDLSENAINTGAALAEGLANSSIDAIGDLSGNALDEMGQLSAHGISENADLSRHAIDSVSESNLHLADTYISGLNSASSNNAQYMAEVTSGNIDEMANLSETVTDSMSNSLNNGMALMAGLTGELGTGNQELMADVTNTLADGFNSGLEVISGFGESSTQTLANNQTQSLNILGSLANNVLVSNQELAGSLGDTLSDAYSDNLSHLAVSQSNITEFLAEAQASNVKANTAALERVAALSKSTSLQGQDLVAKSASDMIRYISIALGVGISVMAVIMIATRGK